MSRLWILLVTLAPYPAMAQSAAPDCPEQDATVCGRRHFETGTKAFEQQDFVNAAAEFQAAMAQRPHPVIRFNLALSLARLGHPSAAIEQLRQVQSDASADKDLRERAAREQASAEQALCRVTFRLTDPSRERIELDGTELKGPATDELSLDPGTHHVRIISGSSIVLDQELDLSPGERVELRVGERSRRIDVVVVPEPSSTKSATNPQPPVPAPAPRSRLLSPTWFYVGAGATVVLTGVTIWSAVDTNNAYSDYKQDLPRLTQTAADARVSDGHSRELRTNLLLAGSLLCGAGTAVLGIGFVDFSGKQQASVGLWPGGVAVSGRF